MPIMQMPPSEYRAFFSGLDAFGFLFDSLMFFKKSSLAYRREKEKQTQKYDDLGMSKVRAAENKWKMMKEENKERGQ